MKIYAIGDNIFTVRRRKLNPEIKVVLKLTADRTRWESVCEGTIQDAIHYIKHQRKLSDDREFRHTIATMCGTSYRAAVEDMGGIR